ncbi:RES domain-containing protein [Myceligenerans xiligouense]|uniref:RES domain-containing protein n=2 Tax=Myceligenerans xiligouense TaxID=253184 RepID=A0A3N4Z652_9MICO|nr:RES domain-containing protein [Myceligenerans xiligouense]
MGFFSEESITRSERGEVLCTEHFLDVRLAERIEEQESGTCFSCGRDDDEQRVPMWKLLEECRRIIEHHFESPPARGTVTFDTRMVVNHAFHRYVFDGSSEFRILKWLTEKLGNYRWCDRGDRIDQLSPLAGWNTFRDVVEHTSRAAFLHQNSRPLPNGHVASDFVDRFLDIIRRNTLIADLPADREVFRGRLVSESEADALIDTSAFGNEIPDWLREKYLSASKLGAAPAGMAGVSRYSPAGVSMFYASPRPSTAMAEIAAHDYTRDYAIMGKFLTVRKLSLLDLTNLESKLPSVADTDRSLARQEVLFLLDFVQDITQPIKPDGREHIGYAATQLIAELIRFAKSPQVDGIALPSAQDNGATTWVFFKGSEAASDITPSGEYEDEVAFKLDPSNDWHLRRVHRRLPSDEVFSPLQSWSTLDE